MGAAAIAVILRDRGSPATVPDPAPAPALVPPPNLGPLPELPAYVNRAGPGPQTEFGPSPEKPPPGTWAAVPLATKAAGLGAVGGTVAEDLSELQDRITRCFDEVAQSRFGQVPVSRESTGRVDEPDSPTLLTLHLEMQAGEVRVVDAPLDVQGNASDGLVACAQSILRGHVIKVPGIRSSGKARLVFPLVP